MKARGSEALVDDLRVMLDLLTELGTNPGAALNTDLGGPFVGALPRKREDVAGGREHEVTRMFMLQQAQSLVRLGLGISGSETFCLVALEGPVTPLALDEQRSQPLQTARRAVLREGVACRRCDRHRWLPEASGGTAKDARHKILRRPSLPYDVPSQYDDSGGSDVSCCHTTDGIEQ